ncbi:MAG: DUF359 domain-containing protein [Candidatus Thorarchaeota archaeon]
MKMTLALNLFDRLHRGHQILIERLRDMPNPVAGITDGELVSSSLELSQIIQPVDVRVQNLEIYLRKEELSDLIDTKIISSYTDLLQIEGTCKFLLFEGPCCAEIEENALNIRKDRLGIEDEVTTLKPVRALDGDKLSSARIRLGEIDRNGSRLKGTTEHPRRLPDVSRAGLQTPKGEVFSVNEGKPEIAVVEKLLVEKPKCVIAVGDVTSETVISEGFIPDICVVDGITKRGVYPIDISADKEYTIYNPPAAIYPEAWSAMATALEDEGKSLIYVEGEEDLMGFPAVLLAELGSVMLYGQPNVGIVWVPITAENQAIAREFLEQMPLIF